MKDFRIRGRSVMGRRRPLPEDNQQIVNSFHELYYNLDLQTWKNTYWLGVAVSKCPLDLWVYQEIITEIAPELIVESGTYKGGSALFMATVCDALGRGHILSIDIDALEGRPEHPRIHYLTGSSTAEEVKQQVRLEAEAAGSVMVILDSDHSAGHVRAELEVYAPLVSLGSYLVVEDTNVNGNPVLEEFGPGPMEALDDFLVHSDEFVVDRSKEKFMLSFNPKGYLRRVLPLPAVGTVLPKLSPGRK